MAVCAKSSRQKAAESMRKVAESWGEAFQLMLPKPERCRTDIRQTNALAWQNYIFMTKDEPVVAIPVLEDICQVRLQKQRDPAYHYTTAHIRNATKNLLTLSEKVRSSGRILGKVNENGNLVARNLNKSIITPSASSAASAASAASAPSTTSGPPSPSASSGPSASSAHFALSASSASSGPSGPSASSRAGATGSNTQEH